MTIDVDAVRRVWREAIRFAEIEERDAYSIPVVEMAAVMDALAAERERVRVLRAAVDALAKPVQLWMAVVEEPSGKVTKKWGCRSFGECNDLITHLAAAALADDDVRAALAAVDGGGA